MLGKTLPLLIILLVPTPVLAQQPTQHVTISTGGKRLHNLIEDHSARSGTRIRCGKNSTDWQTRDLPLDVYAKGVPLAKLLSLIAEASHLALTSGEITQDNGSTIITYAVGRDRQREKELLADEARSLAEAAWTWDVFEKLGRQAETNSTADKADSKARSRQLIARIIASLPDGSRDRVLSGEAILLNANTSSEAKSIRELAKITAGMAMTAARGIAEQKGAPALAKNDLSVALSPSITDTQTDADAKQTMLRIQLFDRGGSRGSSVVFALSPMVFDPLVISYDLELKASDTDAQRLGLPARPVSRTADSDPDYDCSGSKRHFLASAKDWEAPILQTKVHLDLPQGDRTYADILSALAATGFTIVCEDFVTCRTGASAELKSIAEDTTIGEVLRRLDACWFSVDEKERVILGWAKNWRGHHRDLVPEVLLTGLNAKIAGDGAELDDVVPLANLTPGQAEEWLANRSDKRVIDYTRFLQNRMLWRLYDALSPEAKHRAKLSVGASLGGIDMDALQEDFRRLRRFDEPLIRTGVITPEDKRETIDQYQTISSALADPARLHQAILRVNSAAVAGGTVYWLEFDQTGPDGTFTMRVDGGPTTFPIKE